MYAAGYESGSDDEGFVFGDEIEKKHRPKLAMNSEKPIPQAKNMTPKGGFGVPSGYKGADTNGYKDAPANPSPYSPEQFKDVVIRGTMEQIKEMIQAGMPVDIELKCGWTVLMYTANMAYPEKLEYLIEAGADINYHKDQYTVLMTACACNRNKRDDIYTCVCSLLDHGASVNTYDRYHSSPLMNAAREGHELVVEKLIEKGADVNKQNNRGWTALSWAVSKGHVKIVDILLKAGADKEKTHTDGQKVLSVARYLCHSEIVQLLGGSENEETDMATIVDKDNAQGLATDKSFQTYGELELFLSGLTLTHLIPVFQKHKITFEMLLRMTDTELLEMSINELGNRKRILDGIHAVHKKEWESTSLPSVTYNKTLAYEEMVAMMANISKHLKYITSSVSYINTQARHRPDILEQSTDGLGPKLLGDKCTESLTQLRSLDSEVHQLGNKCHKVLKKGHFKSPDAIDQSSGKKSSRHTFIKFATSTVIVAAVIYWRQPIISSIFNISSKIQRFISVENSNN